MPSTLYRPAEESSSRGAIKRISFIGGLVCVTLIGTDFRPLTCAVGIPVVFFTSPSVAKVVTAIERGADCIVDDAAQHIIT